MKTLRVFALAAVAFLAVLGPALAQSTSPGANALVQLWLAQSNLVAGPQDYTTCIPPGQSDQICTWNAAKLGPQPTTAQLDALIPTWQAQQAAAAAQANAQAAVAQALAAGLAIVSASTPALDATYAADAAAQAAITSVITGVAAGAGLPGGGSTFLFMDAAGAPHAVTQAQFLALATSIRNYVYALDLYAAGQGAPPAASATIP